VRCQHAISQRSEFRNSARGFGAGDIRIQDRGAGMAGGCPGIRAITALLTHGVPEFCTRVHHAVPEF
jgi:hypothetical protein